ncbi:MAG: serine hydrolase domain-containing protein [Chloroflexota bacterium]
MSVSRARLGPRRPIVVLLAGALCLAAVPGTLAQSPAVSSPAPGASAVATARWTGAPLTTTPMSAADAAAIDTAVQGVMAQNTGQWSGIWVGVWDPTKGYHVAGYGDAAMGGPAATAADNGRIGSITKTFTATAILRLIADGKLALDDTIADVLPDLATELPEIAGLTVEQLLGMTSGLPEYESRIVQQVIKAPQTPIPAHDIIVSTVKEQGIQAPGTAGYSTTNYLILGEMLTALTGQSPEDVLNALAQEAGLTSTALPALEDASIPAPASAGYVNDFAALQAKSNGSPIPKLGDVSSYNPAWGGAGGAMYSNVEDLGRWAATGFGNTFLPQALGEQRLASHPIPEGKYGLGILDFGNGWYGHSGEILGWNALAAYNPTTGAAFTLIINESGSLLVTVPVVLAAFPDLVGAFGG